MNTLTIGFHDVQCNNFDEGILTNMLLDTVHNIKLTRTNALKIPNAHLIENHGNVLLVVGNNRDYYTSVPYDVQVNGEKQELHGNSRNRLAKEFVKQYSLEHIATLEAEYIQKQIAKEEQKELDNAELKKIFVSEIKPLFTDEFIQSINTSPYSRNGIEINDYTNGTEIVFICIIKDPNFNHNYVIYENISIKNYEHNHERFIINFGNNRMKNISLDDVKSELMGLIEKCRTASNEYERLYKLYVEKSNSEAALNTFIWNALIGETETIIRKKNTFIAIRRYTKFSIGDGKEGKYFNVDRNKLYKMIATGYNEFYTVNKDEEYPRTTAGLKNLHFMAIPGVEFVNS